MSSPAQSPTQSILPPSPTNGRRWFTPNRADRVFIHLMVTLIGFAVPAVWLARPVIEWIAGTPLDWTTAADQPPPYAGPASPGAEANWVRLRWSVADPDPWLRLVALAPILLKSAAMAIGALTVLRLLRDSGSDRIFTAKAPGRIALIGMLTIGWGLIDLLSFVTTMMLTMQASGRPAYVFTPGGDWLVAITLGGLLMLLAQVWRRAVTLREDNEGVI